MNRIRLVVAAGAVAGLGALSAACRDEPVAPTQATVAATLDQASERVPDVDGARIINSHRGVLRGDIVHYTYDVALGPGQFDVIRLHRVVRERRPHAPVETEEAVFLLPGNPNAFVQIFMEPQISSVIPWDQSVAAFLAENDIDVWGMDYAWALVPAGTADFGFMRGWGLQKEIRFAEKALSVARSVRASSGEKDGRLPVLGYSYGVYLAYAIAGDETQEPARERSVKGLIPVDEWLLTNDETQIAAGCAALPDLQSLVASGVYQDETGIFLKEVGDLARTAPGDVSQFYPPLTNLQFALFVGASGNQHFVGGYFDQSGNPTGLRYTDPRLWVDLLRAVPPYAAPTQVGVDLDSLECNRFDYHLHEVTVPILYIGAAGGLSGRLGYYNATITASRDVTKFTVQLLPDDQVAYDFGHADLFTARDAQRLVWQPILNWLLAHRSDRAYATGNGR